MAKREKPAPRSFRLSQSALDGLERLAAESGRSVNALAQRFIDEGIRMQAHPKIQFRDTAIGRCPALAGSRLYVWQLIETLRSNDNSIEQTAEYLGIGAHRIQAAVDYYADFRDEVDDYARRAQSIADREHDAFRRRQAILD